MPHSLRENIRRQLLDAGCCSVGFAEAAPVSAEYARTLHQWLADGRHASMQYMTSHEELRLDPRKILADTRTVISVAIPYLPAIKRPENAPQVALYASGKDYHKHIVKILRPLCRWLSETHNVSTRICVDSAPVAERYWALQAGIGLRGKNGTIIHPQYGSYIFLAEILTSLFLQPDPPSTLTCDGCDCCRRACPGQAIMPDGTIDARRCLSYLTIEHRGPYSSQQQKILDTPTSRDTIFGCDICQKICPLNRHALTSQIEAFAPTQLWLTLDSDTILNATPEQWESLTRGSALRRADLTTLQSRLRR